MQSSIFLACSLVRLVPYSLILFLYDNLPVSLSSKLGYGCIINLIYGGMVFIFLSRARRQYQTTQDRIRVYYLVCT